MAGPRKAKVTRKATIARKAKIGTLASKLMTSPKSAVVKLALQLKRQLKSTGSAKVARALFATAPDADGTAPPAASPTVAVPSALVAPPTASTAPSFLALANGTAATTIGAATTDPSPFATLAHQTNVVNGLIETVLGRSSDGRRLQIVDGPHAKTGCAALRALGGPNPKDFFLRPVRNRWFNKWTFIEAHLAGMDGVIKDAILGVFAYAPNWTAQQLQVLETLSEAANKLLIIAFAWAYTHDTLKDEPGEADPSVMERDFSDFVSLAHHCLLGGSMRQAWNESLRT